MNNREPAAPGVEIAPPVNGMQRLGSDGRPLRIVPCKYFPNCTKMEDPEHNAFYSHTTVVKRQPRNPPPTGDVAAASMASAAAAASTANPTQLCGFGENCKRCGDEEHLNKYIHACKFGSRCKKIEDPLHLKHFIHVLPPPTIMPPFQPRGRLGMDPLAGVFPPVAYPPFDLYGMYGGAVPGVYPGAGVGPIPGVSHHARASGYHPYGARGVEAAASPGATGGAGAGGAPYGDRLGRESESARAYGQTMYDARAIDPYGAYNYGQLGAGAGYGF